MHQNTIKVIAEIALRRVQQTEKIQQLMPTYLAMPTKERAIAALLEANNCVTMVDQLLNALLDDPEIMAALEAGPSNFVHTYGNN